MANTALQTMQTQKRKIYITLSPQKTISFFKNKHNKNRIAYKTNYFINNK